MLFYRGEFATRCDDYLDPQVWLTAPHCALDLAYLEVMIRGTGEALSALLSQVPAELKRGAFVDICSGNGLGAIHACWPNEIDLMHVDLNGEESLPLKATRLAWLLNEDERGWERATVYLEENFMGADVTQLARDPEPLFEQVAPDMIKGALFLNPTLVTETAPAAIMLAARILPTGAPLIITTESGDTDDVALIQDEIGKYFATRVDFPDLTPAVYGMIAFR